MNSINAAPRLTDQPRAFDLEAIRADFPVLEQAVRGKPLVYLDNAATAQKPARVIEALAGYYREYNANIHRGLHTLSEKATAEYEAARDKLRQFINAQSCKEIIFVRGATEAINLVAQSYGRHALKPGDELIITELEHHSNIVPWQLLCEQTGAALKYIPINDAGELILADYDRLLSDKTRLVAVGHISNALGTINPVKTIIDKAHAVGAKVLIDGAQAVPHGPVDVRALACDFYAFSGHKLFGSTGIGVLYGKQALLEAMPPYQGGGDMIRTVSMSGTTYNDLPYKFEAGTPHIAGVIALGAAVDYVNRLDFAQAIRHETALLDYANEQAAEIKGLRLIGTAEAKTSILSFTLEGIHPHDIGTILDDEGIAIRAGHHCAMPVMERFGIPATARASFAFYNSHAEVDALMRALDKCKRLFG